MSQSEVLSREVRLCIAETRPVSGKVSGARARSPPPFLRAVLTTARDARTYI
jgi:hypothetical protein